MPRRSSSKPPHLKVAHHLAEAGREIARFNADRSERVRPGSQGAEDIQVKTWDHSNWGSPTFELIHDANLRLVMVSDLLLSMGAILREKHTFLSLGALTRTLLEISGTIAWIYDPDADLREKVCRRQHLQVETMTEMLNLIHPRSPGDSQDTADPADTDAIEGYIAAAHAVGISVVKKASKVQHDRYFFVPKPPSQQGLIVLATTASYSSATFGPLVQRYLSALAHGQTHGMTPFIQVGTDIKHGELNSVEVSLPAEWLALFGILAIEGADVAVGRTAAYLGWEIRAWDAHRRESIRYLLELLPSRG